MRIFINFIGEHGECWFKVPRLESVKWIKSKSPKVQRRRQKPRRVKVTRNYTNPVRISKWRATPIRTFKMTLDTVTALIHRWIDQMEKKTRWSKHLSDSLSRLHLVLLLSAKRCSKFQICKKKRDSMTSHFSTPIWFPEPNSVRCGIRKRKQILPWFEELKFDPTLGRSKLDD